VKSSHTNGDNGADGFGQFCQRSVNVLPDALDRGLRLLVVPEVIGGHSPQPIPRVGDHDMKRTDRLLINLFLRGAQNHQDARLQEAAQSPAHVASFGAERPLEHFLLDDPGDLGSLDER
jgi:hypothetical protein